MIEEMELLRISVETTALTDGELSEVRRSRRTKSCVTGSTVSFHQIDYFVDAPAAAGRRPCRRSVAKQILHDVR